MAGDTVIPSLVDWGVSAQADLVFRALVAFGPWSVADLSGSLGLRARQISQALDELAELDAVAPVASGEHGQDRLWLCRPPSQAIERVRRRQRRLVQDRQRLRVQLARIGYPAVLRDPAALNPAQARPLFGADRTMRRFVELNPTKRFEHLAMNPERAFGAAQVKKSAPLSRANLASGITLRTLGVPASPEDESGWFTAEMFALGAQYRELPEISSKLFVFDRKTAFVPLDPGNQRRGYWEITEPEVVERLVAYFYEQWEHATEPPRQWTPPPTLSPREAAIVVLLADGDTDATIAGKLDLSVRTIAYTISGLMDRYQVTNRFQLGLRLGAQAERQSGTGQDLTDPTR